MAEIRSSVGATQCLLTRKLALKFSAPAAEIDPKPTLRTKISRAAPYPEWTKIIQIDVVFILRYESAETVQSGSISQTFRFNRERYSGSGETHFPDHTVF
jgi:hypothetical protein